MNEHAYSDQRHTFPRLSRFPGVVIFASLIWCLTACESKLGLEIRHWLPDKHRFRSKSAWAIDAGRYSCVEEFRANENSARVQLFF